MSRNPSRPIGVFDSGIGGLTVLHAIRALLPHEHLSYVADSVHLPYGDKSPDYIQARALAISRFLIEAQQAKAIVVACNTATAAAVTVLRATFAVPIIAMEPAIKPAVAASRSGTIGVLATTGTANSGRLADLMERFGRDCKIITQPCPGLVECVEQGQLTAAHTRTLLQRYIHPLLERGADALILGCTHYPFLRPLISEIAGPHIAIIETGDAVAREVSRRLAQGQLLNTGNQAGHESFWTSGDTRQVYQVIRQLWPHAVSVQPLPEGGDNTVTQRD